MFFLPLVTMRASIKGCSLYCNSSYQSSPVTVAALEGNGHLPVIVSVVCNLDATPELGAFQRRVVIQDAAEDSGSVRAQQARCYPLYASDGNAFGKMCF